MPIDFSVSGKHKAADDLTKPVAKFPGRDVEVTVQVGEATKVIHFKVSTS